jgi:mRNA-degrading endonuclease RelE of RelBE toxin-antitoxin system
MFPVILENRAEKELKRLDKRFIPKVLGYLRALKTNPLIGIKMEGEFQGSL